MIVPSGIEINEQVVSLAGAEAVLVRLVDESALCHLCIGRAHQM